MKRHMSVKSRQELMDSLRERDRSGSASDHAATALELPNVLFCKGLMRRITKRRISYALGTTEPTELREVIWLHLSRFLLVGPSHGGSLLPLHTAACTPSLHWTGTGITGVDAAALPDSPRYVLSR